MKKRGRFITLEGPEGSGKSTQIRGLASFLKKRGRKVLLTREPGGPEASERIRQLLLDPRGTLEPLTELLLYEAARAEHVARWVEPALKKGVWVLCDRFTDSTIAYQGAARNLSRETIAALNRIACQGVSPDLTFVLDIDARTGLKRAAKAKGHHDRLEKENLGFHQRVRRGFLEIAKMDARRVKVLPPGSVSQTLQALQTLLLKRFSHEL